jgi:hypothetical protein
MTDKKSNKEVVLTTCLPFIGNGRHTNMMKALSSTGNSFFFLKAPSEGRLALMIHANYPVNRAPDSD